ncbi:MAG: DUF11 domain-containing protein [Planctomycetes bacterium]|nr:DUF11 domain-containing protein [Planctomycetota bacterium]
MHVGIFPLMGALAIGGPPAPPATPGITLVNGSSPTGIYPVPGQGPPGAVAALGAIVPRIAPTQAAPVIPAPLVAAKFLAPKGVRVTAFPGSPLGRMFDVPTVLGLRPGFVYRFALGNLPGEPGKTLYPEVELRGVLVPRPGMKYMDYPIPLLFSPSDIDRALSGNLITKVIYLEDPEKAIPAEASADAPIEIPEDTEKLALKAAFDNGRLMAIVRIGNRKPSPEELAMTAIDGTILFPGEKYLKAPMLPPVFAFWNVPFFDPLLGPRGPKEECFENGADKQDALGIGAEGRLGGLNPTDVGVEYTVNGKRKVTTSCVACICSPRYIIRRAELIPTGYEVKLGLAGHTGEMRPAGFNDRLLAITNIGREKTNEFIGRVRPSAYVGQIGTSMFIGMSRPIAIAQVFGVKVEGTYVEPEQLTAYPTLCPLTVTKVVDPPGPKQQGEIVTVVIRYANTGTKAASDIVISDSLSGRLAYVPGSAQTDRPSNFSSSENEVGSLVLRWELPGTLLPGQAGTIKFKAKIR